MGEGDIQHIPCREGARPDEKPEKEGGLTLQEYLEYSCCMCPNRVKP